MNYGKLLENYLPENNPLARPQSPDEMMRNLDGSVTATRIRQAITSGNVEQLESELRMSDDLLPFESLYVSQGETGEPQIQVVSMLEPGIEPSLEPTEIPVDFDAETEAEIARLDAEQDMVEQGQQGQQGQQVIEQAQQAQQGQQVPMVRAEFIPPETDYLSQTALDERKAKLPPYKTDVIDEGGSPFLAIYEEDGKEIGRATFSIDRGNDDVVTMFIDYSEIGDEYRNKGYGEALYREIAKYAQSLGVTRLEGIANTSAKKVRSKLFEQKPDPLGLDMHRIDIIRPDVQYMPQESFDDWLNKQGEFMYHGSPNAESLEKIGFDLSKAGSTSGYKGVYGTGIYLTNELERAELYGKPIDIRISPDTKLWKIEAKDAINNLFTSATKYGDPDLIRELAINKGYDGIEITNSDVGAKETVIFDPSKIKTRAQLETQFNNSFRQTQYLPEEDAFYSRLQRGIQESKQATYSPDQAKALARKSTNAEELKWSGIENAIDSIAEENNGKVPKQALLDYMENEGQVKFEEVILQERGANTPEKAELDALLEKGSLTDEEAERVRVLKALLWSNRRGETAKYGPSGQNKVLPGGENYHEVVLTMPTKTEDDIAESILKTVGLSLQAKNHNRYVVDKNGIRVYSSDADPRFIIEGSRQATPEEDAAIKSARNAKAPEIYTSSHYPNIPNYVAHMRVDDRKDAEGKKGRFIQEFQSDRHQQGRKKGYIGESNYNKDGTVRFITADFAKIPDAPFRKDWPLQMFKRALRDAVADGKEWIGWTDGETQADRYDLSQQVSKVSVTKSEARTGQFRIEAFTQGTSPVIDKTADASELPDIIGKELAQKIVSEFESDPEMTVRDYRGEQLKVGGEGMKGFYDNMLPKEIGRYVDKMGGKVEKNKIPIEERWGLEFNDGGPYQGELYSENEEGDTLSFKTQKEAENYAIENRMPEMTVIPITGDSSNIWRVNITPEMAATVRKGQPQYLPAEYSDEYGLEEGQEAETRLTPRTLYNLYYIATEPEPTSEYGREITNEYIDKYKRLYVDVFSNLVRQQIQKYIGRGRVDSNVTKKSLDKADTPAMLDELMRGTYRSDMRRRNDVWNLVTEHLKNLSLAKTKKDKIFYMDRLNNSIHNTQELLFSKFSNYRQLQEAFDSIHNARDTRAFSQRVDKDLRESNSFNTGTAYLPYVEYELPKDPRKIMADFYLLTSVGDKAGYFGKDWQKIKDGQMPSRTGLRYEEYGQNLEDAVGKLTEQMKRHMTDSLLFSVTAELRHAFDQSQPSKLIDNEFMNSYRDILATYKNLDNLRGNKFFEEKSKELLPESQRTRISKGSRREYQLSNMAIRKAMEETNTNIEQLSNIAENLFRKGNWAYKYGGEPWGDISEGLRRIHKAESLEEIISAIDNAYDLQHNTNTVFDKIQKYSRQGGYKWLEDMLDFKYHAITPRELVPLSSSSAKRIATPALIDIGDPALDKSRENAVAASSEELVSGVEAAIGRLKENQEDVYNDIWVKAKKGSGKDINLELFKWLRAQMPARKDELEAVGVNQDLIRYARLLLAEKMAPVVDVPSDIKEMVARSIKEQKERNNDISTFLSFEDKKAMSFLALNATPDSDPKYQKVMRGIYEKYTADQVKAIFDWYLKYKNQVGGLLEKPLENIQAPYTAKVEKSSLADLPEYKGEPDFPLEYPEKLIQSLKEMIVDPNTGEFTPNKFQKQVSQMGKNGAFAFEDVKKVMDWGDEWEKWAYTATESELYPSAKPEKQELKWVDKMYKGDEYDVFENGDQPSGTQATVYVEGKPQKAAFVLDGNGLMIILNSGDKYSIQFATDSLKTAKEMFESEFLGDSKQIASDLKEYQGIDFSFIDPAQTKKSEKAEPEATPEPEQPFDIEEFWPESLNFMSPGEIDFLKKSIQGAIAAGKNSEDWLNEFEMYGQKATNAYSPDSQKELKKLFDAEAKKLQKFNKSILSLQKAETHFNWAVKNYSNYGWKEIPNSSDSNALVGKLIGYPVDQNAKPEFWQTSNTLTIGNRTYVGWTPKNDNRIFILYGDYNNSGEDLNYNWIGAAQFEIANKTTEEIISEISEWFKGEIDYFDPQI